MWSKGEDAEKVRGAGHSSGGGTSLVDLGNEKGANLLHVQSSPARGKGKA